MTSRTILCEKCGCEAAVKHTEGVMFPSANSNHRIILVIDCPTCGRHEQPQREQKPNQ